jgi:pimeloyl-ACP methyl ester carboxylesterase
MRDIIAALMPHYAVYTIDPPGDGYTTPLAQNPDYKRIYTLDSIDQSLLAFLNTLHMRKR